MLQDARTALRSLSRQPGFFALAILIVAIGAGANAAVFSVVRAVLLAPLPYARPDRLVSVWPEGFISNGDLDFMRQRVRSFAEVGAASPGWTTTMLGAGEPARVTASKTSANLFTLLGVRAAVGRTFEPGEDLPGRHRVVVLSHPLWQSRFGADPRAVGRTITVEDAPHLIIGVMPAGFEFRGREAELWLPLPYDRSSPFWRGTVSQAVARLRDGVDPDAAAGEMRALVPDWQRELGYQKDWGQGATLAPLHEVIVGDVRRPLLILLGAVGLVVMLTAANLGTLLLGRHVGRRRDMAVRGALGASAWRLGRETGIESLVLALSGATVGLLAARVMLPVLVRLLPPDMPRVAGIGLDPVVLLSALIVSVLSVVIFGTLPSLLMIGTSLQPLLRLGAQSEPRGGRHSLHVLVVGQIALAIVLGAGAALMGRSLLALRNVDPGFEASRVLTMKLQPSGEKYRGLARTLAYYREVVARLQALPGVEAAGAINHLPLSGYNWTTTVRLDQRPLAPGVSPPTAGWRMIDGDYFASMGIPLLAGRQFTTQDTVDGPAVAIVNEAFAARFFGSIDSAPGRVVRTGSASGEQTPQIVGVVGNVRHTGLATEPAPEMYRPVAQSFAIALAVTVRTSGPPARLTAVARDAVWSVDPQVPIADLLPLETLVRESLSRPRLLATLLLVFAAMGLVIVTSGVYGVVAYSVRRRERELGIRLALGAAPAAVGRLVMRQGVLYATAGLALGLPMALAVAGAMRSLIFGIEPRDPVTFAALSLVITAAAMAATVLPALRARRVDPATVLRAQ